MSQPSVILATAGYDHTIRFWEAKSGRCYRTLQYPDSVTSFRFVFSKILFGIMDFAGGVVKIQFLCCVFLASESIGDYS